MDITFLGQAGLFIETKRGSILCDPWFNTAYFASWFPFPSNEEVDIEKLSCPTYLYLSHLHHDHFDPQFLREHVWKEATVLLPDYPLGLLEKALRELGFTKFIYTKNCQTVEVDGLSITIVAMTAPIDGPLGDSSLIVNDGETCVFNQNDSRPIDLDILTQFGPFDAHFLQFSGAIWYPMVYQFPEKMMQTLSRKKRENQMARALRYAEQMGAAFIVPSAGPPCFLDEDLFHFNDFNRDETNTFPDQTVFLEYMQAHGKDNGRLMIPGSVATFGKGSCSVVHPYSDEQVEAIFTEKRAYLEAYQARQRPLIEAAKASWPRGQVDILSSLRDWFEPLLRDADLTCVGVNGRLLLDLGEQGVVIDFQQRKVYAWQGEEWEYKFEIDPALIESSIIRQVDDWINDLFLSCRFKAQRKGPYNEYIYIFFKGLTPERLQYIEGYYAEQAPEHQFWESNGYRIQRRCPHLKADLTRFGKIEDGVLTCTMHGWQFELATGRCLTSDDRKLYAQRLASSDDTTTDVPTEDVVEQEPTTEWVKPPSYKCSHCLYVPLSERRQGKQ
ncbi:MAG TPA: Rieske 2Fe-2S domain-containing protein [Ktedonobacteraceae bacterium]|nr:Rieske 2Fe-2S domain-containing protein [Ktedonobacteraceae bacterium]